MQSHGCQLIILLDEIDNFIEILANFFGLHGCEEMNEDHKEKAQKTEITVKHDRSDEINNKMSLIFLKTSLTNTLFVVLSDMRVVQNEKKRLIIDMS
jgi:hypothetical protein